MKYDVNKSHINKEKHGIDFEESKKLFFNCSQTPVWEHAAKKLRFAKDYEMLKL